MTGHKTDCDRIDDPLEEIHGGIVYDKDVPKIIFCTPRGDLRILTREFIASAKPRDFDCGALNDDRKIPTQTHTIQQALQYAGAGCIIQLLPGKYYRAAEKAGIRASKANPVVIRGMGKRTIICGTNVAVPIYPDLPRRKHYAFLKLINCKGVEIRNLSVESCWPCFIYTENCQYITVRRIR